jgi:hypothetical protein
LNIAKEGKCLRRISLIIEITIFLLLATLSTALYGKDVVKENSSSESKLIEGKINRGLSLALEAINIARNNNEIKDVETNVLSEKEGKQSNKFPEKELKTNTGAATEKHNKVIPKIHNPLTTEPIKIRRKKHDIEKKPLIPKYYTAKVKANKPWTRTNVYLKENDIVRISCKGKVMPGAFEYRYENTSCLAEGYHFTRDNFTVLPNARYMAAIGKISSRDAFYVGSEKEFKSYVDGPLYLGINDLKKSIYTGVPINKRSIYWKDNIGYFEADIYVYRK